MRIKQLWKSPNYANKSLNYSSVGDSWIPVWVCLKRYDANHYSIEMRNKHNVVRQQQERAGVPPTDLAPYPTRADALQLAVRTAQGDAYSHIWESLSRNSPIPDRLSSPSVFFALKFIMSNAV